MNRHTITATATVLLLLPLSARGQGYDYAKIADTNTTAPSGGLFGFLDNYPTFDGSSVAFYAQTVGGTKGIYVGSGGANAKVADNSTPIPGGLGVFPFNDALSPSISNGKVAFTAYDSGHTVPGLYTNVGGGLNLVADSNTPLPSGSGTYTFIGGASLDGGNVAFYGYGVGGRLGVYSTLGGLHKVANQNDTLPSGSGTFTGFSNVSASGGNVAFWGSGTSSQEGIYTDVGGTLHAVANKATPIPNGIGTFNNLYVSYNSLALSAGNVAFLGTGSAGQWGIYSDVGGTLQAVADTSTPIPNGSGNFVAYLDPSFDHGSVAFVGSGPSGQVGIFTNYGGTLVPVVNNGTLIDGKTVNGLTMSNPALSNGNVAFEANFSGGAGSGIYVAEQTYEYTAGASGTWDIASNWSFGLKPRTVVYTNIHPTNGVVVTGPSSATTIRGLDLGATTSGQAELRLQASGQLSVNEYLYVEPLGKLSVNGGVATAGSGIYNYGDIDLGNGGQINGGILQNSGTLHGSGTVGNAVYNYNKIQAIGTPMSFTQPVYNLVAAASIQARNALLQFGGGLSNAGSVNFSFGTSDVFGAVDNVAADPMAMTPGGQIIVSGNSNATFYDPVVHNGDVFRVSAGSTAVFFGQVSGAGAFTGSGAKFFEGGYSPGNSPASVSLDGLVTFGDTNTLKIELGGTTLGSQYDHVTLTAQLALSGTLQVMLINGFTPASGASTSFDILDWPANGLSGTFSSIQLPNLAAPLGWDLSKLYTAGELTATAFLRGDWDRDGAVTSADLPVMLKALTDLGVYQSTYNVQTRDQLLAIGDINQDYNSIANTGGINNADIQAILWLLIHGAFPASSPSAVPVPEPSSLALCVVGLVLTAAVGAVRIHKSSCSTAARNGSRTTAIK